MNYSLAEFAALSSRDVSQAAHGLARHFNFSLQSAFSASHAYRERAKNDPGLLFEVIKLDRLLHLGRREEAILLLSRCFGLVGSDAINVIESRQFNPPVRAAG